MIILLQIGEDYFEKVNDVDGWCKRSLLFGLIAI